MVLSLVVLAAGAMAAPQPSPFPAPSPAPSPGPSPSPAPVPADSQYPAPLPDTDMFTTTVTRTVSGQGFGGDKTAPITRTETATETYSAGVLLRPSAGGGVNVGAIVGVVCALVGLIAGLGLWYFLVSHHLGEDDPFWNVGSVTIASPADLHVQSLTPVPPRRAEVRIRERQRPRAAGVLARRPQEGGRGRGAGEPAASVLAWTAVATERVPSLSPHHVPHAAKRGLVAVAHRGGHWRRRPYLCPQRWAGGTSLVV
jgi:hypothetical protein